MMMVWGEQTTEHWYMFVLVALYLSYRVVDASERATLN